MYTVRLFALVLKLFIKFLKGKFFVESSKRYNSTMNAHSIIYHENDINLNANKNRKKRSEPSGGPADSNEDDDHLSCGSAKDHIRDKLVNEQKNLYDERRRVDVSDLELI